MTTKRYKTLDGMRGIAALTIVILHAKEDFSIHPNGMPEAFLAVDFFFLLSGFVIANAYQSRLKKGLGWLEFMRIRWIRFYPLYIIGTLLGFIYAFGSMVKGNNSQHYTPLGLSLSLAFSIFMLPSAFYLPNIFPFLFAAWSLFYELLVNAAYAVFFGFFLSPWSLLVFALNMTIVFIRFGGLSPRDMGFWPEVWICASRVAFSFSAGLLIQRLPEAKLRILPVFFMVALVMVLVFDPGNHFRTAFEFGFIFVIAPCLVYFASAVEPSMGVETRVYEFFGAISYAVYVLHEGVFHLGDGLLKHFFSRQYSPYSGLFLLMDVIMISAFLDRYFDIPVRRCLTSG